MSLTILGVSGRLTAAFLSVEEVEYFTKEAGSVKPSDLPCSYDRAETRTQAFYFSVQCFTLSLQHCFFSFVQVCVHIPLSFRVPPNQLHFVLKPPVMCLKLIGQVLAIL